MTYQELLVQFVTEHNKKGQWSPFDNSETQCMAIFADWLDNMVDRQHIPKIYRKVSKK